MDETYLEDVKRETTAPDSDYLTSNPFPHDPEWWRTTTCELHAEWKRLHSLGQLRWCGLPLPLEKMVKGEMDDLDKEIRDFRKLAGVRTPKDKIKEEAAALVDMCHKIIAKINGFVVKCDKQLQAE